MSSYLSSIVLCFIAVLAGGCNGHERVKETESYVPLTCGLYRDQEGEIYLKSFEVEPADDSLIKQDVYIGYIWSDSFRPDANADTRRLRDIVDTATFRSIGYDHYRDTNNIYRHFRGPDGGSLSIVDGVHKSTFRLLTYFYAIDSLHVYCNGDILEEADASNFIAPFYAVGEDTVAFSGKDKNHYFYGRTVLSDSEGIQMLNDLKKDYGDSLEILSQ
jgi:hypothetical protein